MAESYELGKKGEELAVQMMTQQGMHIIEQRWKSHHYEIDIIAFDPNSREMVFCEVKTRATAEWGNPEEAIDWRKIKRTVRAADHYMKLNNLLYDVRFDVFAIVLPPKGEPDICQIKDAFYAPLGR